MIPDNPFEISFFLRNKITFKLLGIDFNCTLGGTKRIFTFIGILHANLLFFSYQLLMV